MKLVCPSCGFFGPPDAYLSDVAASRALLLALSAPAPLAQQVQQYIRLFRPEKRAMASTRVVALLEELLPMILEAKITWRGVTYPAPVEYWREAMDEMITGRARLDLPMKNHNYLLAIIAGYAKRADAASEQARIAQGRGETPVGRPPVTTAPPLPDRTGGLRPPPPARSREVTAAGLQAMRDVLSAGLPPEYPITQPAGQSGTSGD